jgi:hypothetical protein
MPRVGGVMAQLVEEGREAGDGKEWRGMARFSAAGSKTWLISS